MPRNGNLAARNIGRFRRMPSGRAATKQRRRSSAGAFGVVLSEILTPVQKDLVRAVFAGAEPFWSRV